MPWISVLCLLVGALTYGTLALMAPRYESEAQLAIDSKSLSNPYADPTRSSGNDSLSVRMDKEAINTHVRALESADLAEIVARDLKLAERREFNSALGPEDTLTSLLNSIGIGLPRASETEQSRVLSAYFKRLTIYSPKESRSIVIRFASSDPEFAAAVANKLAETYRERLAHQSLAETDEVQKALEPKIAKLTEEAAAAEAAVEKFRGEANLFKGGQQQTGLNEQQLAELNAELSKIKAMRNEAEARAKQAREMLDLGSADALPDVQKSPLIQNLVQSRVRVERQISELSATLLPGHPRMRQLNADLSGLKTQIKQEVAKIVDSLAKEAKVAGLREDALAKNVAEVKARIVTTGPDEARLRSLEADAKSKRAELDRLRAQYENNRVRSEDSRAIPVEADIVSGARPASTPSFPKKGPMTLLAMSAVFLLGLAWVITRGLLVALRGHGHQLVRPSGRLSEPVLPVERPAATSAPQPLPEVPREVVPPRVVAGREPNRRPAGASPMSAAVDRLVMLRGRGFSGVRSLLTTADDAPTLAQDALGLSSALAAQGSTVLIIDWSLENDGIAEAIGRASAPGLIELIKEAAGFEDVVVPLDTVGVHMIPAGSGRGEAGDELDADRINALLDALDGVYDHILVAAGEKAATELFEALEGRFDCGIRVCDPGETPSEPGSFLGFAVDGLEIVTCERAPDKARLRVAARLLARAG